jgi:hypothetical protein
VARKDWVTAALAGGLTRAIAEQANACTHTGAPDPAGRYVMIQSDGDIRRRPWGMFGLPPIPDAIPIDAPPQPGLFDALFQESLFV